MPELFQPPANAALQGKTIVLTGGAAGIGESVVRLANAAGAHIFFGDVNDSQGEALAKDLHSSKTTVKYIHCDVSSYADNLRLFDTAFQATRRVDHAISNAGIGESGNLVNPDLTLESVREEPTKSLKLLDVNLKGPIYFARIASVYLRQPVVDNKASTAAIDKSLTFTSSVAAFREDPGLSVYVASKHGVMGLMRVLRSTLIKSEPSPIRTNTVCPWMTITPMTRIIKDFWADAGLPANQPEDVAKILLGVASDSGLNGEAVLVEGGRGWKIEEEKIKLRPQFLGERVNQDLDRGTVVLGGGEGFDQERA